MKQAFPYRNDVQGLRAIAVLLVMFAHSGISSLEGGFIGVDIFFVISGFVITRMLISRKIFSENFNYTQFLLDRLLRLAPVLLFVILITTVSGWFLFGREVTLALGSALIPAAFMLSNLHYAHQETGYFDELAQHDWWIHTWSLGVEAQFYLVWPIALFLLYATFRSFSRWADQRWLMYLGGTLALAAMSFTYLLSLAGQQDLAFYYPHARAWQFLAGAALALYELQRHQAKTSAPLPKPNHPTAANPWPPTMALYVGLALILAAAAALSTEDHYPSWNALIPTLGAALIIAAGMKCKKEQAPDKTPGGSFDYNSSAPSWLESPPLNWLGDRSYSLYLWHWPVFVFTGLTLGSSLAASAFAFTCTLLLATLSYRWIERPFWKGRWKNGFSATPSIPKGFYAIAFALGIALGVKLHVFSPEASQPAETNVFALAIGDLPPIYAAGCDRWFQDAHLTPCWVDGQRSERKTAVLLADSIGAQWQPGIRAALPSATWNLLVLTKSACPVVDQDIEYPRVGGVYTVCREWRDAAIAYIHELQPDLVIFGSSRGYGFSEEEWRNGTARLIQRVQHPGLSLVLWLGNHHLGRHGPQCLMKAEQLGQDPNTCNDTSTATDNVPNIRRAFETLEREFSNVTALDPNPWICPDHRCRAIDERGRIVFRDHQHLTASFAAAMGPNIQAHWVSKGVLPQN